MNSGLAPRFARLDRDDKFFVFKLVTSAARWVVTHDFSEWKDEIAWMSLYFSGAVWASLALCAFYAVAIF